MAYAAPATSQPIVIGDLVTLDDGRVMRANSAALAAYLEQERRHVVAVERKGGGGGER